jgi:hypothetical protein
MREKDKVKRQGQNLVVVLLNWWRKTLISKRKARSQTREQAFLLEQNPHRPPGISSASNEGDQVGNDVGGGYLGLCSGFTIFDFDEGALRKGFADDDDRRHT